MVFLMSNTVDHVNCETENKNDFQFCPLCQAPLQFLKISPLSHVAACCVIWENLPECQEGLSCLNPSIFHYRDYSHHQLADYRSSCYYIGPSSEELKSIANASKNKTPVKSPRKSRVVGKDVAVKTPSDTNQQDKTNLDKVKTNISKKFKYKKAKNKELLKNSSSIKNVCELSPESYVISDEDDVFNVKTIKKRSSSDSEFVNECLSKKLMVRRSSDKSCDREKKFSNIEPKSCNESDLETKKFNSLIVVNNDKESDNSDLVYSENDLLGDSRSESILNNSCSLVESSKKIITSTFQYPTEKNINNLTSELDNKVRSVNKSEFTSQSTSKSHSPVFTPKIERRYKDIGVKNKLSAVLSDTSKTTVETDKYSSDSGITYSYYGSGLNKLSENCSRNSDIEQFSTYRSDLKTDSTVTSLENKKTESNNFMKNFNNKNVADNLSKEKIENALVKPIKNNSALRLKKPAVVSEIIVSGRKTAAPKPCPFYKRIPDTSLVVDAFSYGEIPGVKAYFLSHFHSDHYIGLKKSFSQPLYCSKITAELVKLRIGVNEKYINIIDNGERRIVNGVEVVAMDANHCPGAVMFLFQLRTGQNFLHVGDFRACREMESYPELRNVTIDKLFLDTTYCKQHYDFPSQNSVLEQIVNIVKDEMKRKPKVLIVCGSYLIGKEKVFTAVAEACNCNIWADSQKRKIFSCLDDPIIKNRLVDDPARAQVHVLLMKNISYSQLSPHLQEYKSIFTNIVAFKPTGWSHKQRGVQLIPDVYDNIAIYEVPYSEHSSFSELRRFVQFTNPTDIIPTVNVGSASEREIMKEHFQVWRLEMKQPKQTSLLNFLNLNKK